MPTSPDPAPLISPTEMQVVERVLNMPTGYVLDLSDRTFDEFIAHEVGLDATAPRFSENGRSKAKRLRRILTSLPSSQQAKLLRAFLEYRDSPAREGRLDLLDEEWRQSYEKIIRKLEALEPSTPTISVAASAWTGRRTLSEQVTIVRAMVPLAASELQALADLVESKRFNDPITVDAVECIREIHAQLGLLLDSVDRGPLLKESVAAIEANRQRLTELLHEGAKIGVVAPAMTFGVMHILSWLTGVGVDSTMVAGIFGAIVGADALKAIGKKSSLDGGPVRSEPERAK